MRNINDEILLSRRGALGVIAAGMMGSMAFLSGCGTSNDSEEGSTSTEETETKEAEEPTSDYVVTIDGCTQTTDYQGNPAIIVDFTFTNNSEEATSLAVACSLKAFQNGVQLESAITTDDLGNGYMAELKPGVTTNAKLAYELSDQSDVSVEVTELISLDDTILAEQTFSLS